MNEITIGDKTYISAKRAAEITGYARDYVGQLCREGHVDAKMVGRSWYVYEPAIRAHRFGPETVAKDAAPQDAGNAGVSSQEEDSKKEESAWERPTYTAEKPDTLPELEPQKLDDLLPPAEETLTDMQAAWREWFEQRQTELQTPEIESPEVIDERNEAYTPAQHVTEEPEDEVAIPLHSLEKEEVVEEPVEETEIAADEEENVPIRTIRQRPAIYNAPINAAHMDIAPMAPSPAAYIAASAPIRYESEAPAPLEHGRIVSERIITKVPAQNNVVSSTQKRARRSNAPLSALFIGISLLSIAVAAIGTGYANRYLTTLPTKNDPIINYLLGTEEVPAK